MDDKIIKLAMPGHDKVLVELKQRYEKVRLKKCFVVCWYGPWPVYFQVYLNSCSYNKGWNWIIFTDTDITNYNVPDNVEVVYRTLVELKDLFEKKLSIRFGKLKPYKLCDFKPSYGLIFEEYLKSYDYWGFCDIDLIWGNLNSIFPDGIISKYDKFLTKGHMTLFKNSEKNKYLFQKEICRYVDYRIILSSKYNWGFDETGRFSIDKIIDKEPFYRCYRDMALIADISPYHDGMYIENNGEMKKIQYAVFNGGGVFVKREEKLIEKAYIHLQKRKILNYDVVDETTFYISDNEIIDNLSRKKNIVEVLSAPNKIHLRVNQLLRLYEIVKFNLRFR